MLFELLNFQKKEDILYNILIFIIVYYSIARPKLTLMIRKRLNCDITRLLIFSLIVYQTSIDYKLSLILASFYLILYTIMINEEINDELIKIQ